MNHLQAGSERPEEIARQTVISHIMLTLVALYQVRILAPNTEYILESAQV